MWEEKSSSYLHCSSVFRLSASYYEVLGVKPDASLEEIKNAFLDKSKKVLSFIIFPFSISCLADTLIQINLQNMQTAEGAVIQRMENAENLRIRILKDLRLMSVCEQVHEQEARRTKKSRKRRCNTKKISANEHAGKISNVILDVIWL